MIQPTDTSPVLTILYELPAGADTSELYWGRVNEKDKELYYKIKLSPKLR